MKAFINGQFVDAAEAKVGFFDAGFQHGIGLFETMLARDGAVLRLEEHLERLATSARELRLFDPLRVEPLAEAVPDRVGEAVPLPLPDAVPEALPVPDAESLTLAVYDTDAV